MPEVIFFSRMSPTCHLLVTAPVDAEFNEKKSNRGPQGFPGTATMMTEKGLSAELRSATAELAAASGGKRLLHLALDAVQTADPAELRSASAYSAPVSAAMLLTLLTCCYARGLYDSRDIVTAAAYDPMIRYLCKGTQLRWETLRNFRRRHRSLLLHCLAWVLNQAWTLKRDESQLRSRGYEWFERQFDSFITHEAIARVEVAASLDSAAGD